MFLLALFSSLFFSVKNIKIPKFDTKIVFAGDIMLSRKVGYNMKNNAYNYVFSDYNVFEQVKKEHKYINLVVANLESPLVYTNDNDFTNKTMVFRANSRNIKLLNQIKNSSLNKILVLSLANNHIRNAQRKGVLSTMEILKNSGIYYVGVGKTPKESHKILKININGEKLCFQAYTYDGSYKYGIAVNSLNKKYIKQDLEKMKKLQCDKKILIVHWGIEYIFYPIKVHKNLAHFMVDNGADIILGNHPHVLQYIEKYKGKTIIYSLGNTVFDQNWGEKYRGKKMNCILNKNKKCVVPTFIGTLLTYNLTKNVYKVFFFRINYGKWEKLDDNILKSNLKKILNNTIFTKS